MFELLRSTGLYAKAGTVVEVTFAKEYIGKMKVIIKRIFGNLRNFDKDFIKNELFIIKDSNWLP